MKKEKKQLKDIPIKEVLKQQQKWWEANLEKRNLPFTYGVLGKKYGSEKLILRKMKQLVDKGYLEYGTSLRTAWLTDKGKNYLKNN